MGEAGGADGGILGAGTLTGGEVQDSLVRGLLWEGSPSRSGSRSCRELWDPARVPAETPGNRVSPGASPAPSPGPVGWEGPVSSAPAQCPSQMDPSCPAPSPGAGKYPAPRCFPRHDSPGTWPAGRNPDVSPEALEAFKKFAQREGLSPEDVFTLEQMGEGPARGTPGSSLRPLHILGPSFHPLLLLPGPRPLLPLPSPSVGSRQSCDGSQGAREPRSGSP